MDRRSKSMENQRMVPSTLINQWIIVTMIKPHNYQSIAMDDYWRTWFQQIYRLDYHIVYHWMGWMILDSPCKRICTGTTNESLSQIAHLRPTGVE